MSLCCLTPIASMSGIAMTDCTRLSGIEMPGFSRQMQCIPCCRLPTCFHRLSFGLRLTEPVADGKHSSRPTRPALFKVHGNAIHAYKLSRILCRQICGPWPLTLIPFDFFLMYTYMCTQLHVYICMSMATHTECFDLAGCPNLWSCPRMHNTDEQVLCNSEPALQFLSASAD